jgi:hypothetical protein
MYKTLFYNKVIKTLDVLTDNTLCLRDSYAMCYEWKEWDKNNFCWKHFRTMAVCDTWHLEDLKKLEEFYKIGRAHV